MNERPRDAGDLAYDGSAERNWTCEEIERLYRQALEAVDAVASDLNSATRALESDEILSDGDGAHVGETPARPPDAAATQGLPAGESAVRVTPTQIVEAFLFVGGEALTPTAIAGLLRGDFEAEFVERAIEDLNRRFAAQARPYEIRLGEGGYRMVLRREHEALRNRVYGFGPKEVRLSQEALEILALVAYKQPITRQSVEEIGKRNAGAHLRQLLMRELVVLDRPQGVSEAEAAYRTSPRFLQLFGLGRLEELPQIEDLSFK